MSELSSLFIKDLPNCYYVRPLQSSCHVENNWSFVDHLSCALPTKKIFNLLRRSIRSKFYTRRMVFRSSTSSVTRPPLYDILKVIIKWLEVSFRECNWLLETPQTNNFIYSRDLVLSDRKTCTIYSSVNFFFSKKILRQPSGKSNLFLANLIRLG